MYNTTALSSHSHAISSSYSHAISSSPTSSSSPAPGSGLKNRQFTRIVRTAANIWRNMNKDLSSGYILTAHLRKYKNYMKPYDASHIPEHDISINWWNTIEPEPDYLQELALKVLAIVPNSASCDWLTNNKRIQLDVQNLESIAKIYFFFNTNAKKGLPYFSAKMTEEQVLQVLNELNGQILEEEIIDQEELLQYIDCHLQIQDLQI
ncbi:hypothetical protein Glove_308g11 [Diversispora epigaea]|uniref:HAT C-terminal dimerisation domain-containing protein n=1 Tax=Diversispora epigaea TaxID=1348612 RepID=A0A397HXN7_9GLOM|nr:hypothetical protein Glove_308g11 [Diversispora epigaea]